MINLNDDTALLELSNMEADKLPIPDPEIPLHIQGTERYVQLLTNVSRRVTAKNRDSIMAATVESRRKIPRLDTKKDFTNSY